MFLHLIEHQLKAFYRAHYFRRNLTIKLMVGFTLFIVLLSLFRILYQLPGMIEQLYPEISPFEFIFRQLIFIYIADLAIRLNLQKIPRQAVTSYMHLPVRRSRLALYALIKSWFSVYNFYPLVLMYPMFITTIYSPVAPQSFWYVMTGIFLLSMLNNALTMFVKTLRSESNHKLIWVAAILIVSAVLIWLFREQIQVCSYHFGMAMYSGNYLVYISLIFAITAFNLLAIRNLRHGFYGMIDQNNTKETGAKSMVSQFFNRIPVYGRFWDLEWKLIMRNKRARSGFYQTPIIMPVVAYIMISTEQNSLHSMIPFLMMAMGSYGFIHLQYVFSWESRFFDYIASRNIDITLFIRSKYLFYCLLACIQFAIISPFVLVLKPDVFGLLLGIFFYVLGPAYCLLFYTGLGNSTRINPNKTAFFNFEGTSGTLFFTIILLFISIMPFFLIGYMLPMPTTIGFSLATGLTGLVFIVLNKLWISAISRNFLKNKYRNLSKYREK